MRLPTKPRTDERPLKKTTPKYPPLLLPKQYSRIEQKRINKIEVLSNLIIIFNLELYGSLKKITCNAQTTPTKRAKYEPNPRRVIRISDIFAPRGPAKLFILSCDDLLKKASSKGSYETKEINIQSEKAKKKKLKKLSNVLIRYLENIMCILYLLQVNYLFYDLN